MAKKSDATELKAILTELKQATVVLADAAVTMKQFAHSVAAMPPQQAAAATVTINTWDDPFSEITPSINPPLNTPRQVNFIQRTNALLQTTIVEPRPPAMVYPVNTADFRYWVAAEALDRGINFWGTLMPAGTTWSTSNPMRVVLLEPTPDLNARYRRFDGLHFYQGTAGNKTIYSAESFDVVCHELGHAVLDALRPQLFNAADEEASAFHESFGDMSAILCTLQDDVMCRMVMDETQNHLNVNSRLSRLAEQLGWAIRQKSPGAVDRDSLRNAANRFFYRNIDELPPSAPANLLSRQPHSFSRIFTGAFLDVLARMYTASNSKSEASLQAVSRELGQIVVDAVLAAPITTRYFTQVAAGMIAADQTRFAGKNKAALSSSFMERGLLSVDSAVAMTNVQLPAPTVLPQAGMVGSHTVAGAMDEGYRLGFGETPELPHGKVSIGGTVKIDVHAPTQPRRFKVEAAMTGDRKDSGIDPERSMRMFVEALIQRREIDLGAELGMSGLGTKVSGGATHKVVAHEGKQVLKRIHFECGFCARPTLACD